MASSSTALPDDDFLSSHRYSGPIPQAPDSLTVTSRPDLTIYSWADEPWREQASCLNVNSDLFFPPRGIPGENIREICFQCPVRIPCLDYSVRIMPKFGWFGGHPEDGRRKIKRLLHRNPLMEIETADAIVLRDSLARMNRSKKKEPSLISA